MTAATIYAWPEALDGEQLAHLAEALRAALDAGQPLVLDLETAGAPGAAAMQLLVAAARAGDAFLIRRPSPAFVDGCSVLGMFSLLMAMPMEPVN